MGCNANSPATLPLTMGIESTVTLEIFVNASPSTANTDGASLNPWLADDDFDILHWRSPAISPEATAGESSEITQEQPEGYSSMDAKLTSVRAPRKRCKRRARVSRGFDGKPRKKLSKKQDDDYPFWKAVVKAPPKDGLNGTVEAMMALNHPDKSARINRRKPNRGHVVRAL